MVAESRAVRARGVRRRQQLLDACLRLLSERGISGVTHRAVAAEAGVPASSTTYFFASLDELIAEAIRSAMDVELERIRELAVSLSKDDPSPQAIIDRFVDYLRLTPAPHTTGQFEIYLHASRTPELQAMVAEIMRATREVAAEAALRLGITEPTAGAAIVALIDGFALHRVADPIPDQFEALRVALTGMRIGYSALEDSRHLSSPPMSH